MCDQNWVLQSWHADEPRGTDAIPKGWRGATTGTWRDLWHGSHFLDRFLHLLVNTVPPNKTVSQILHSGDSWKANMKLFQYPGGGTSTRLPHKIQPSWKLSSTWCTRKGLKSGECEIPLPSRREWQSLASVESRSVHFFISLAVTGRKVSISMPRTVSPGTGTSECASSRGSLLNPSAFPWDAPGLYSTV